MALALAVQPGCAQTADVTVGGVSFKACSGQYAGVSLPYREARINLDAGQRGALVLYLHGGSDKGNDNLKPVNEVAVGVIATYLKVHGISATFIVPQCPQDKNWGGTMNRPLAELLNSYLSQATVDPDRVYALGGSMGGSGTWSLVSDNPGLFAAAMPVAGDPSKALASNVAKTPIYTVMGTADEIMSIDVVQSFMEQLNEYDGVCYLDIEDGWTHEDTCQKSYTDERLDWVFAQRRQTTGIGTVEIDAEAPASYYSLDGKRLSNPVPGTVVLESRPMANGHRFTRKVIY